MNSRGTWKIELSLLILLLAYQSEKKLSSVAWYEPLGLQTPRAKWENGDRERLFVPVNEIQIRYFCSCEWEFIWLPSEFKYVATEAAFDCSQLHSAARRQPHNRFWKQHTFRSWGFCFSFHLLHLMNTDASVQVVWGHRLCGLMSV